MSLPPSTSTVPGRARRGPRVGALVGAGLLLLPVVEIAVAVQVGLRIGAGWTVLLLLLGSAAGLLVLRRAGLASVRRLATRAGDVAVTTAGVPVATAPRPPAQTAPIVLAGVLLLIPGFVTDVAGACLLLPRVRRGLARRAEAALVRRFDVVGVRVVQGQVIG
ncbi:MAG TPA: FxsA family protein, partial [Kineosporiaceae bacterium]|nr:FxsA family protein [Kineosporiaceae bacterium]